ncbi:MAG: 50S ribosomal protein L19e [Candidatus Altiarchaeales archaeon]|nr:50S ribosomal protein L19e [Candidatus Altiarchaeales archaeon]
MNLKNQRRIAAKLLKVGLNRVQFNKERVSDAGEALTREDVRSLIKNGVITIRPEKAISRYRARKAQKQREKGSGRGHGKRRGKRKTRTGGKEAWIKKVRALREELAKLKEEKKIDKNQYRSIYRQIKGNLYHSRRHLRESLERARK